MHRVITCYMHNRKYRLRYGQSVTCLFHSVKFFALAVQSTLFITLREIYPKGKNSNKQSNHKDKTKDQQTNTKVLATNKKTLKGKGVDALEGDRWNVNSRESTGKEFLILDYE